MCAILSTYIAILSICMCNSKMGESICSYKERWESVCKILSTCNSKDRCESACALLRTGGRMCVQF